MKTDTYTKTILTVIALLLAFLALHPLVAPDTAASAQSGLAGVQFVRVGDGYYFFDTRTSDIWTYNSALKPVDRYQIKKLGEPMTHSLVK